MVELRILNGYHRGATLPLHEAILIIGASDDADVVLVDPGVAPRHASLQLTPQGWTLAALDGDLRSADSNAQQQLLHLAAGDFARAGQIWLTVVEQESAWQDPPPMPTHAPADSADTAMADDHDDIYSTTGAAGFDPAAAGDESNPAAPLTASGNAQKSSQRGARKRRFLLIPVVLGTVLFAAAAYAITAKYPGATPKTASIRSAAALAPEKNQSGMLQTPGQPEKRLSQEALRQAFRQRLEQVDLLKRFNLKLDDYSWSMQAALDEDEAQRFQRMLAAFMAANQISFPVDVKIGSAEAMLPFKIQQVISGANASIVTQDGNRLYIGDEYRGMRLAAIDGNQLSFTGKRIIEVKW
ncbi:FHA domain-containing protein [Collimonas sp.]|jgi:type III secretion protein D|uniref:FHA domain-containing protein n=1 Tax=Collimonas sp. TaxID=1963772 RepID=UPI002CDC5F8C|nr:FHA domain-containing protein [Collimonas sp.]HWW05970.1 FHA domain-containing protein [Collimonas sp.]